MGAPQPLSEAEMAAAAIVGKAMLKGMKATKLPRDAQVRAAIHALIAIGSMPQPTPDNPLNQANRK